MIIEVVGTMLSALTLLLDRIGKAKDAKSCGVLALETMAGRTRQGARIDNHPVSRSPDPPAGVTKPATHCPGNDTHQFRLASQRGAGWSPPGCNAAAAPASHLEPFRGPCHQELSGRASAR